MPGPTATEAGRPLYASLGFAPIADLSACVLGNSTQLPGEIPKPL